MSPLPFNRRQHDAIHLWKDLRGILQADGILLPSRYVGLGILARGVRSRRHLLVDLRGLSMNYQVGTALGIKDSVTGTPAVAVIYDGDSVLCTFHGSAAKENAEKLCRLLNFLGEFGPEFI